jgi:hypothetical protein
MVLESKMVQAYCLTSGQMTASALIKMTNDGRARLVADSLSMTFQHARSLADILALRRAP